MRIVVALGGNALLHRGKPMTAKIQRGSIRTAAEALAAIRPGNQLVITHGNGPQVGPPALQAATRKPNAAFALDVLEAESEGMIGYMIEQELRNRLPLEAPCATVLTMVEVDRDDPAFRQPRMFVGPCFEQTDAERLMEEKGWRLMKDGERWRRVVASPDPLRILQIRPIERLLDEGTVVIAEGGAGIPMVCDADRKLRCVEAVIDNDLCSELLARQLGADLLVMATDVDAVYLDWGKPQARAFRRANPMAIREFLFPPDSMGPKVEAACIFAEATGKAAVIGALEDLPAMLRGGAGTFVSTTAPGIEWAVR